MVADTCSGHMLQGNRWWTVKVDDEGNNHATVSLETWSVDRPVGVINTVGYTLYSTEAQSEVWTNWFTNIASVYDGTIIQSLAVHSETNLTPTRHDYRAPNRLVNLAEVEYVSMHSP